MQTPQQASGGGPGESDSPPPAAHKEPKRWWVVRSGRRGGPEVITSASTKSAAMKAFKNWRSTGQPGDRFGIIEAATREVALSLWDANREAELERQTRPGAAIPAPGTEAGRTHAEDLPQLGPKTDQASDERAVSDEQALNWSEAADYQEDDDETQE